MTQEELLTEILKELKQLNRWNKKAYFGSTTDTDKILE